MQRKHWNGLLAALVLASLATMAEAADVTQPGSLTPANGAHWYKLDTETYKGKQDDIWFVDKQLGFYVNGKGKIWRTHDGGSHWEKVLEQPGTYFRTIAMLDARHGFAGNIGTDYFPGVTDNTPLYETIDGGDSWHAVKDLPGAPIRGLCAIDVLKTHFINAGVLEERTLVHAGGRVG